MVKPVPAARQQNAALDLPTSAEDGALELSIIGDGAVDLAAGFQLAGTGHTLRVLTPPRQSGAAQRRESKLPYVIEFVGRDGVTSKQAPFLFENVTSDPLEALKSANGLLISAATSDYAAIIKRLQKAFRKGQTVLLVNAPLGAGLQFAHECAAAQLNYQLNILELGKMFDCAKIDGSVLRIACARDKVSFCGNSRNETRRALSLVSSLSQALVPSSNLLEHGFAALEKIIRPTLIVFGLLGGHGEILNNPSADVNPFLMLPIKALEAEIQSICKSYGVKVRGFLKTMTDLAAVPWHDADCLDQALITVGPTLLAQLDCDMTVDGLTGRALALLKRDASETLVLIESFARAARLHTPVLTAIIELAKVITKSDLHKIGRNLEHLGLFGLDCKEITERING